MSGRIKVCQVLSDYIVGGAEMVALDVARALDRSRFESHVVAVVEPPGTGETDMLQRFREAGIPAHTLHHRRFRDPRTLWDMVRFFRRLRPHIVHGHKRSSDYWACVTGRWAGVPHRLWTRHSVYADMSPKQIRQYRTEGRHAPVVVAVSDAVRRNCIDVEGLPAAKVRTVVNGVDTERFAPLPLAERDATRHELGLNDNEEMLLMVGRLAREKAPEAFVEVVRRLRDQGRPVRGFLCGTGPLDASIGATASAAGVTMLGVRRDVPRLLNACDLVVSTSRVEGLPLNLMEAMAAGAAFVGPDLDQVTQLTKGAPDLVSGLYRRPPLQGAIPEDLVAEWAMLAAARLDDPAIRARCGTTGRLVIQEHYSLQRMADAYAAIYEELIDGRSRLVG